MNRPRFRDIKQFPNIHYRVTIPFDYLKDHLGRYIKEYNLNLNPDFQRGHVWNKKQKIEFVEYALKNPSSGLDIYFNHPEWMNGFNGEFVIVDGKQRLNAMMEFLNDKFPVFGYYYSAYEDRLSNSTGFFFNIACLKTRKEVLKWYLDFNTGGTIHSKEEITKVKKLIQKEALTT